MHHLCTLVWELTLSVFPRAGKRYFSCTNGSFVCCIVHIDKTHFVHMLTHTSHTHLLAHMYVCMHAHNHAHTTQDHICFIFYKQVIILDVRVPSQPVARLGNHRAPINGITWAPHSSCHICTAGR